MELIFRKVDPDNELDIARFDELMDELSQRAFDDELLKERIAEVNLRPNAYLMVVQDAASANFCGSLIGIICEDFCGACAPFMLIENVVTNHNYRRCGVGRAMFEEIERWGRERGVRYAILCSANNRAEAHEFYPAIGYDEIKGYKKYF